MSQLLLATLLIGNFAFLNAGIYESCPEGQQLNYSEKQGGCLNIDRHHRKASVDKLELVNVASENLEGYQRFIRSAKIFNVSVTTLGLGKPFIFNGDALGGGYKLLLFKDYIEQFKDDKSKVIVVIDSYDVIVLSGAKKILSEFEKFDCRILISAEGNCWPDPSLAPMYPVPKTGKRFINSGALVGYAPDVYNFLDSMGITTADDDQLLYSKVFIDESLRGKFGLKLDHESRIFQNLYGATDDVELQFNEDGEALLHNKVTGTNPLFVHGNGPSKNYLNILGNYLPREWTNQEGCISCKENLISLEDYDEKNYPVVLLAVLIERPTAFVEEFLDKILQLNYPKKNLHLFVYTNFDFHAWVIDSFLMEHTHLYRSVKRENSSEPWKVSKARERAMGYCYEVNCEYYFNVNSEARLDNPETLKLLVEQNRPIVAPMLVRPNTLWSNFWASVKSNSFLTTEKEDLKIVQNYQRGLWNVQCVKSCFLIKVAELRRLRWWSSYQYEGMDADHSFCHFMMRKSAFMYVSNRYDFGHLVVNDNFDQSKTSPDIYQIKDNPLEWEQRYIHKRYSASLKPNASLTQPCPNVYVFPLVTDRFCKDMIEIIENFKRWPSRVNEFIRFESDLKTSSPDILPVKRLVLEKEWEELLRVYVTPFRLLVFPRHLNTTSDAVRNFIVQKGASSMTSLHAYQDTPQLHIEIALSRPNVDYMGGGSLFTYFNCSVTNIPAGSLLMYPSSSSHDHDSLQVSSGVQYVMVSDTVDF